MHTYLCRTQISHPSIDEPPLTFLPRAALACQPSRHRPAFFGELSTLSQLPAYRSLPQDVPAGDVNSFIPPTPRAALSPPTADASSLESGVASKGYHAPRLPRSIPPDWYVLAEEHSSRSTTPRRLTLTVSCWISWTTTLRTSYLAFAPLLMPLVLQSSVRSSSK
jgi:hypothetical protein